jgi:hypothetical protein
VGVVVVVTGQGELLEVVLGLRPQGRLAHFLHGGQEQADEHGDDGDHHQQLDQREATPAGSSSVQVHKRVLFLTWPRE